MAQLSAKEKALAAIQKIREQEAQVQPVTEIVDTPLDKAPAPPDFIQPVGGVPKEGSIADMYRFNTQTPLEHSESTASKAGKAAEEAAKIAKEARDELARQANLLESYFSNQSQRPDFISSEAMDQIQKEIKDLTSKKDEPSVHQMIQAAMPGLLGLVVGGSEAGYAAKDTQETSDKAIELDRKLKTEQRKSQLEALSKRMEGVGSARKAELDFLWNQERNRMDALKASADLRDKAAQYAATGNKEAADNFYAAADALDKNILAANKETAGTAVQEAQMENQKEIAKINAQAANQRAAAARAERPPTEGERKSAGFYGEMIKASEAIQRIKKDHKGKLPSEDRRFYAVWEGLQKGQNKNQMMGEVVSTIANPMVKRQLQAEADFLGPYLYGRSGANITLQEYISAANRFFERFGDSEEGKREKAASMQQAIESTKGQAGRAPLPKIIKPEMSNDDKKALEWAKKNPNDQRAIKILKKLGM